MGRHNISVNYKEFSDKLRELLDLLAISSCIKAQAPHIRRKPELLHVLLVVLPPVDATGSRYKSISSERPFQFIDGFYTGIHDCIVSKHFGMGKDWGQALLERLKIYYVELHFTRVCMIHIPTFLGLFNVAMHEYRELRREHRKMHYARKARSVSVEWASEVGIDRT